MRGPSVGLDIVEIGRIRGLARRNPRFLKRVFTQEEIRYCESKKNRWQHFAVRFAAKEAVWKTLSANGVGHKDISVVRAASGRPEVYLRGKPARAIQISLSHSRSYAAAVAIRLR